MTIKSCMPQIGLAGRRAVLLSALILSACAKTSGDQTASPSPVMAYTGAYIFDGTKFEARPICISDKMIVACGDHPETTINLDGLYITPPFGDAHTHHFDGIYTVEWHMSLGRNSGTFYAMTMTAPTSGVVSIRERLNGSGAVDVATSMGGITGPDSHPAEIYEALALGIRSYEERVERYDEIKTSKLSADDAYYVVETPDDVRRKLTELLDANPNHIKVFLRDSQRYNEGYGKWGPGGGINPELLPLISTLTKQAGKRLAVSASSLSDFRAGLDAEADIITHLPCYQDTEEDPASVYFSIAEADECLLSDKDAEKAAQIGLASTLITTEWEKDRADKWVAWEIANIDTLKSADTTLVVATNNYGSTLTPGLIAGVEKGFFTAPEMLELASMKTPKTIFPDRNIGCLKLGCEASFIAFSDNPLENFKAIEDISFALKDGAPVELTP